MDIRIREHAGPALFEAIFVMLGVVLALVANEWRESRQHRNEASAANHAITAELSANRAALSSAFKYHSGLLDTLRAQRQTGRPTNPGTFSRGFVAPAQLSSTTWQVAAETGVLSHMPYPAVLSLSRAYAQQQRYEQQAQSVGQLIYSEIYRGGPAAIASNTEGLVSLIGAFAYRERQMLALFDSTLTTAEPSPNGSATR